MSAPLSDDTTAVDATATDDTSTDDATGTETPSDSDKGFPAGTPVAEMTVDQQVAYYKYHNRQAENKLAKFKGVTPKQFSDMQNRLKELEDKDLTAGEKALKDAVEAAKAEATAALLPRLQLSEIRSAAASVLDPEQLEDWLEDVNPAKFIGENGEVDKDKVVTKLNRQFGKSQKTPPPTRQWGQFGNQQTPTGTEPGSAGRAEAQRRSQK